MPSYNFKRKVKFYVVIDGLKYQVEINPDLSFSQTFNEEARRVKTLHAQKDMFERATITKANPANFEFTMPLHVTLETKPVYDMLLDYANSVEVTLKTCDIYVDTGSEIFKLEKAVFENGTYNISKAQIVSVSISGTASKLSHFGPSGTTIPGSIQTSTVDTLFPEYYEARFMQVLVDSVELQSVVSVNVEIANEVEWLPNDNLHKSLAITGPSDTVYPEAFVLRGRTLSGSIQQYVTDTQLDNLQKWAINVPIEIKVAREQDVYQIAFNFDEAVYTNRLDTGELFTQTYDFRMVNSPYDLGDALDYISDGDAGGGSGTDPHPTWLHEDAVFGIDFTLGEAYLNGYLITDLTTILHGDFDPARMSSLGYDQATGYGVTPFGILAKDPLLERLLEMDWAVRVDWTAGNYYGNQALIGGHDVTKYEGFEAVYDSSGILTVSDEAGEYLSVGTVRQTALADTTTFRRNLAAINNNGSGGWSASLNGDDTVTSPTVYPTTIVSFGIGVDDDSVTYRYPIQGYLRKYEFFPLRTNAELEVLSYLPDDGYTFGTEPPAWMHEDALAGIDFTQGTTGEAYVNGNFMTDLTAILGGGYDVANIIPGVGYWQDGDTVPYDNPVGEFIPIGDLLDLMREMNWAMRISWLPGQYLMNQYFMSTFHDPYAGYGAEGYIDSYDGGAYVTDYDGNYDQPAGSIFAPDSLGVVRPNDGFIVVTSNNPEGWVTSFCGEPAVTAPPQSAQDYSDFYFGLGSQSQVIDLGGGDLDISTDTGINGKIQKIEFFPLLTPTEVETLAYKYLPPNYPYWKGTGFNNQITSGSGSIFSSMPSSQEVGDLCLLLMVTPAGTVANSPNSVPNSISGWTQLPGSPFIGSLERLTIYYKIGLVDPEPSPLVQASTSTDHIMGRTIVIGGIDTTTPFDVISSGTVTGTTFDIPSVTTTTGSTMILHILANGDDASTGQFYDPVNANLVDLVEKVDNSNTLGNGGGMCVISGLKNTAGAIGTTQLNKFVSETVPYVTIAIRTGDV